MNESRTDKFENTIRLEELNPKSTLERAGFKSNMILCDIGAGTGIFSFPAAIISKNDIYALEISDKMIELLVSRIEERGIKNLIVKKVETDRLPIEGKCCDFVLLSTVFHEIDNKPVLLGEIKRILNNNGKLLIIEFHKRKTPTGPPEDHRISEECVEEICNRNGFRTLEKVTLGDNFYYILFEQQQIK